METLNGTSPDPTRFLKNLRLLVSLLVTAFLQGIITFFVGGMAYFLYSRRTPFSGANKPMCIR